jgi:hypothetical protein
MNKSHTKFFVLLLLSLRGGIASADVGRFGSGFFGFGKNNVESADGSHKDLQRQKQVNKAPGRNGEKRTGLINQEQGKEANKQSIENSTTALKKNRLTPDERRALRRQIRDASNDLNAPSK